MKHGLTLAPGRPVPRVAGEGRRADCARNEFFPTPGVAGPSGADPLRPGFVTGGLAL